ncbi:MAG: multiubiquitin domain-containing protein [Solirubrobacterales bacterium]
MTPSAGVDAAKKPPDHDKKTVVHIDRKSYEVREPELTGAQLRQLPDPAVGPEFDLWLEVPGGEDRRIGDDEEVVLKKGMHFFTAPSVINPGASC